MIWNGKGARAAGRAARHPGEKTLLPQQTVCQFGDE